MRRSRTTVFGVFLVSLVTALTSLVAAPGPATGEPSESALLGELRAAGARIARHATTDELRYAGGSGERPIAGRGQLGRPGTPTQAAGRFMGRYGRLFGVSSPRSDLRETRSDVAIGGNTVVRYQQQHRGVPVLGAEFAVQVAPAGDVIAAVGEASPDLDVATDPAVSSRDAGRTAVAAVARALGRRAGNLAASAPELWIYDPVLLGARDGMPFARLVWRTEVTSTAGDIRELVLVDASRGGIALHFSQIAHARNRVTCDGGGTASGSASKYPCTTAAAARLEAGGPTGIGDVDRAHDFAGHTYDFFFNRFGRDSLDGAGMALVSTVRYCPGGSSCPYANAFWDGSQMVYGTGFAAADDVVGHELTHGVTQFSSGLFYYYQSGAINEALSDIFGEYIDLTNGAGSDSAANRWLLGEDLSIGAIRDMENPTALGQPDRMRSNLYDPDDGEADGGGVHSNSGVANKAAFLMADGGAFNGQTISGLGIDKAAAIWYRAATVYLRSASDYADLGTALNQACTDLVGTTPKQGNGTPSPTGAITAANCTEVAETVVATEMSHQPTVPGTAAPEAPLCASGTPIDTFVDNLENTASGNWTKETIRGANAWYYPQNTHPYGGWDATYATSGTTNMWGDDTDFVTDSAIRMTSAVTVPSAGFLHFRHAYGFDDFLERYDGGVLEYQVASGAWTDAAGLTHVNGYSGTLATGSGNPLAGRRAFSGESNGYISSRYNLASLAGKSVKFRFRIGTDDVVPDYGWFIDDIRIYTCSGTDASAPTVTPPDATFLTVPLNASSKPANINVSFTATDAGGISDTTLQQSVNSGAYADVSLATATTVSKALKASVSKTTTRRFRARATDGSGIVSGYATGPLFRIRAYQNGSSAVVEPGSWTTVTNSNHYGGSVRHTSVAGRTQSLTKTATDFAVVSTLGPNRGKVEIRVDGVLKETIDLYRSTTVYRQVIYAISFPTAASHTIELRVLGTKNAASSGARVDFDAFLTMAP